MNKATINTIVVSVFSILPYLLISLVYTALTDGHAKTFWMALGLLYGARLFFGLIETLSWTLLWHFYGKKQAVNRAVEFLRVNQFPMRKYHHDNFSTYLSRIQGGDDYAEYPQSLKASAIGIECELALLEELAVWPAARMRSAWETALDHYAPREGALKVLTLSGSS